MSARGRVLLSLWAAFVVGALARAEGPPDRLLVQGNGFAFGVREPPGWHGSIEEAARLSSNVVFYRQGESPDAAVALVRIRINDKTDENLDAELAADMDHYRSQYPKIEFHSLSVPHPSYRVVAKLFALPGEWYEYVAYVNPGPGKPWIFGTSMNKQRREATPDELAAFRKVVASLELL